MTTTIEDIFRPEELRKATDPAKRVALSELEQLLRATRDKWAQAGMVNPAEVAA